MSTTRSPAPRERATDGAAHPPGPRRREAALVLIAHGAAGDRNAARILDRHAARLRRRRLFAEVRTCFLRHDPSPESVLAGLAVPDVYLMPMLMSDGYILREQIVRRLGLAGRETLRPAPAGSDQTGRLQRLLLCPPVGTHPGLPAVIDRRLRAICDRFDLPAGQVCALLVAHGTPRHRGSWEAAEACRAALAAAGRYAAVRTAFLEEAPLPDEALRLSPAPYAIAVGLFLAEGLHGGADVPDRLGLRDRRHTLEDGLTVAADATGTVFYAGAIGADAGMTRLILACVRAAEMAAGASEAPAGGGVSLAAAPGAGSCPG